MPQKFIKLLDFTCENREFTVFDCELYDLACEKFIKYSKTCGLNSATAHVTTKKHIDNKYKIVEKPFDKSENEIL